MGFVVEGQSRCHLAMMSCAFSGATLKEAPEEPILAGSRGVALVVTQSRLIRQREARTILKGKGSGRAIQVLKVSSCVRIDR